MTSDLSKAEPSSEGGHGFDTHYAAQLAVSYPAKARYNGGIITEGPLAGRNGIPVKGLPSVFDKDGRLKKKFAWIKNGIKPTRNYALNAPNAVAVAARHDSPNCPPPSHITRKSRQCNVVLSPPHANTKWTKDPIETTFTIIQTNLWTPQRHPDWPPPPDWPTKWTWPTNPTFIPHDDRQCELCLDRICSCILISVRQDVPAIVPYGDKGEGAQAQMSYLKGELLGELLRELAPLEKYEDGWGADLVRKDIGSNAHAVCQVYCRYVGNWVRKINHSCNPCTSFSPMKISGKWRIMIEAIRNIAKGEEITVFYGAEYWEGDKCLCGSTTCISNS